MDLIEAVEVMIISFEDPAVSDIVADTLRAERATGTFTVSDDDSTKMVVFEAAGLVNSTVML
jgi:hypothetical protein